MSNDDIIAATIAIQSFLYSHVAMYKETFFVKHEVLYAHTEDRVFRRDSVYMQPSKRMAVLENTPLIHQEEALRGMERRGLCQYLSDGPHEGIINLIQMTFLRW